MRTIKVFILKLWLDEQAPDDLRGSLQAIPDGKTVSFGDGPDLLSSLQCFAREKKEERAIPRSQGETVSEEKHVDLESTWELRSRGRKKKRSLSCS